MMTNKYNFRVTTDFDRRYQKYTKNNQLLKKIIVKTINELLSDPFHLKLKTHKVNAKNYGVKYSSKVTADLRIIWDFYDQNTIIILYTIGGHSGKNSVY